jgi:XTP/dITP diphosphohydrolase
MNLVLATRNHDKVAEIADILGLAREQVITMDDAGYLGEIDENGATFAENALIKARAVFAKTGGMVIADDSGLCIDVLDGRPGIYSARFAGENADYPEKFRKIYEMLMPFPLTTWTCRFVCAIALIRPDGSETTVCGEVQGLITPVAAGGNGFGYDPIFYVPAYGLTMAQLDPDVKNRISHRGQALIQLKNAILQGDLPH